MPRSLLEETYDKLNAESKSAVNDLAETLRPVLQTVHASQPADGDLLDLGAGYAALIDNYCHKRPHRDRL